MGLFCLHLFKSLLHKPKTTTRQGSVRSIPNPPLDASDPADPLFAELTIESEEVPAPCLFLDVVQRQWSSPGLGPNPSGLDRCLYNMGMDLSKALLVPSVDAPVVALSASSNLPGPPEENLRPKDKRSEQLLVKVHQASAWAVKAASSSLFLDRASLLWLWQLQARLPISNTRSHQDINKIIASLEFSADATLNASRFAARAIGLWWRLGNYCGCTIGKRMPGPSGTWLHLLMLASSCLAVPWSPS